ncbi:LysR family transcriptional regulator [Marinobacterium lutimaris]|uniref:DNA-binding transcriptional regulator, LysR family n=1 Tax=Marinobacterium lutimaris TaxID=568106 RepID=A0A1H6AHY1_9GAMM|nr:LysR family transcriptional regulator [Marinobacterium lutimaris]SEG47625.1 DNA-binding transcriptional regulator, LysR family [Marinobacterium lutimaris]
MFGLKELEAFAAVMDSRSLTDSARELYLPKSTMSRRIRHLETALGQRLLRRESNRLIPTEAGHLFYQYCQQILNLASQGHSALEELSQDVSGRLDVYCHDLLLRGWFSRQVLGFMDTHRGLEMQLHTQFNPPGPDMVEGICIWVGSEPDTALRCEKLGVLRQGIYGHPDYLQRLGAISHPREVAEHAWVDLTLQGNQGIELWHPGEGYYRPVGPSRRFAVDSALIQVDAIVNGGGVGLVPHWTVELRMKHHPGTLEQCLPDWQGPSLGVYLLYPYGQQPRRAQVFIDTIRHAVPESWRT